MRRPDLLLLVAIWEFATAAVALIGSAAIVFFGVSLLEFYGRVPRAGGMFAVVVGLILLFCFVAVALIGGIGILLGKEWGRIISIVQAALSMIWVPVGTVIGVLILVYLMRQDVVDYFTGGSTPKPQPPQA